MIEEATNGDFIIGILRSCIKPESKASQVTKDLAQYILDDPDPNNPNCCRRASLMIICQVIFECHPPALAEMNRIILAKIIKVEWPKE